MNHFSTARREAIQAAKSIVTRGLARRLCLLFDLEGRIRVLAELEDGHDAAQLKQALDQLLHAGAEFFWTGEAWFQRSDKHPLGKLKPSEQALYEAVWSEARQEPPDQVFVLDRRFSKDAWFDATTEPPWPQLPTKTPPIISFYGFKGGVGRTTALASIAVQLARAGRRVLIIDFDLEAPGLASLFPPPAGSMVEVGVVDFLLEQPVIGGQFDVQEMLYAFDDKSVRGDGDIRIATAGRLDDAWYLEKLSRLNYLRLLSADPSGVSPLHQLLKMLKSATEPDVVLIDSRAGLHDLGGLALSTLAHMHVLFGLDSAQSWAGLRLAVRHLGSDRISARKPQRDCLLVQSHVPPLNKSVSVSRFLQTAYDLFCEEYYDPPANPKAKWPVPDAAADEQPHFPCVLTHDARILGYDTVSDVADYLCEAEYASFANRLLANVGMSLSRTKAGSDPRNFA